MFFCHRCVENTVKVKGKVSVVKNDAYTKDNKQMPDNLRKIRAIVE